MSATQPAGGFGAPGGPPPPDVRPPVPPSKGTSIGTVIALSVGTFLVVLLGTLVVLAFVGFRRYVGNAKRAEVLNTVGLISKQAAARYEADEVLCPSAVGAVPVDEKQVGGQKYASARSDWHPERKDVGFGCLRFSFDYPQYYQYDYRSTGSSFEAIGRGDIDGDGIWSRHVRGGRVVGREVELDGQLRSENAEE